MNAPRKDPVATAQGLTEALSDLSDRLEAVAVREAETSRRLWRTVAFVVVDIALSVLLVFNYITTHDNGATVAQLHSSTVTACQASNGRLVKEDAIWQYVLNLLTPPKTDTPAQRAAARGITATLRQRVDTAYATRDCSSLYSLKGK